MKKAVFIVVVMMLIKPIMPVLDYIINYDYIANELCVNKAKPQMHCNGKCHLMKELAKAAEEGKTPSHKKSSHTEVEVLFCEILTEFSFKSSQILPFVKNETEYTNMYSHLDPVSFFHPPTFIS